ncbi:MAG: ATP-binding protein [Sphingomonas sp. 32-62-10]|nr:MAG: ATP-binding protein [Sphingomonas sp. 12-62-6]OYX38123.1 MAG: ATP-binding protein [Sphingomonas sp. 32-62-10]
MNRVLKDGAAVPLFFAQTLISSLRDVGYNTTTSALCEHVDNAIQAGADEVRVYFRQTGKTGDAVIDAAIYDNGRGMAPNVLKVATSFGGSMNFNNRSGIGRFGMGMKTAALSMSPVMELYSWQEPGAYYNMTLDVEAIGRERSNAVELPDPTLMNELPDEITDLFTKPMSFPNSAAEQDLLVERGSDVDEKLGASGTVIYMPDCDRLTYAKSRTLVEHAVKEMSRVYRRAISSGLKLYVNNRLVEAFDPTYSMANARHTKMIELSAKTSRLLFAKSISIPLREHGNDTAEIVIRLYRLPIEEWSTLTRKVQKNDLQIFNGLTVSMLRNDREVFAGPMPDLTTRHTVTHWYRIQIDFPGELDEAFGVAANKQGVRPKGYVRDAIKKAIGDDITTINDEIRRFQGAQKSARNGGQPSSSEAKATESDQHQAKPLELTAEEEAQLDDNLRTLAIALRRNGESDDAAFERIKASKYLIEFKHDEYWPFYHVEHRFGRVILTLNTAHPFFDHLYEPLRKMGSGPELADEENVEAPASDEQGGPLVALELLLLSLGRAQSQIGAGNEEAKKTMETLRREWSETYRIQLNA